MTIVRIIKEKLRLDACKAEDVIDVPYSPGASWKSVGTVRLVKIKPLAKAGMAQIKVKSRYGKDARVQKFDIPAGTIVVREREATEADGPDAGTPMRAVVHHEGIVYHAIRPGDDPERLLAKAVERQRPQAYDPAIDDMIASMPGGAVLAQVLASATRLAGLDISPVRMAMPTPESFAAVGEILAGVEARRVGPSRRTPQGAATGLQEPVRDAVRDAAQRMVEDRSAGLWKGD